MDDQILLLGDFYLIAWSHFLQQIVDTIGADLLFFYQYVSEFWHGP